MTPSIPDRATVERIIREEAAAAGVPAEDVIHNAKNGHAVRARRRAIWRIVHETGCSSRGLGSLWGIDHSVVARAASGRVQVAPGRPRKPATPPTPKPYDANTLAHLAWAYGPERTRAIFEGRDPATNADLAAWRRVCA